jgi:hypothetical protein
VALLVGLAVAQVTTAQQEVPPYYTPADDASWAIHSDRLSTMLGEDKQKLYDKFIIDCEEAIASITPNGRHHPCVNDDLHRVKMNRGQPSSV